MVKININICPIFPSRLTAYPALGLKINWLGILSCTASCTASCMPSCTPASPWSTECAKILPKFGTHCFKPWNTLFQSLVQILEHTVCWKLGCWLGCRIQCRIETVTCWISIGSARWVGYSRQKDALLAKNSPKSVFRYRLFCNFGRNCRISSPCSAMNCIQWTPDDEPPVVFVTHHRVQR